MSDLKKWLETVSNESAEHSADIEAQTQLKEDEASAEVGDNEKLSDDPSRTDAEATVKVEGSDTAVSVEDDAEVAPEQPEEPVVAEVDTPVEDDSQTEAAEPVEVAEPAEVDVSVENDTDETVADAPVSDDDQDPLPAAEEETELESEDEDPVTEETEEAVEEAIDETVEEVAETTDTGEEPTVVEPVEETPADVMDESAEGSETTEASDSEEPLLEVDPVAEITEGEEPTPVEGEEEEDSFEDFDAVADAHITDDMDGVEQDIDDMGNMQTALEAYGELLTEEMDKKNGVVDPTLVRAIQIGLESFNEPVLLQGVPSLEDFTDPAGRYVVSLEFAEGLKDKAGKVAKATMAAIQRLWELLEDIFRQFKANVPGLEKKNDEIKQRLSALTVDGKGTVNIRGASRLMIGDNFGGDNPATIKEVRTFGDRFMLLFTKELKIRATELKARINSVTDESELKSIVEEFNSFYDTFDLAKVGLTQVAKDSDKEGAKASPVMLGNRQMHGWVVQRPASHKQEGVESVLFMELKTLPASGDGGKDVKLPDRATLQQLLAETRHLTSSLDRYIKLSSEFKTIRNLLDILSEEGDREMSTAMIRFGQLTTRPTGAFVGYVGNLVRVLQGFIEYCINEHQAAVTDV